MLEDDLVLKLAKIEALFAGATTPGEQAAAGAARERILSRLREAEKHEAAVPYRFSLNDMWSRRLFVALLRRYGIDPYRRKGQRYTTVMARVSPSFVDDVLWPEFVQIDKALHEHLSDITNRVISQAIHGDTSEADIEQRELGVQESDDGPQRGD